MAHTNYFFDPSYWFKFTHNPENPHAYRLQSNGTLSLDTPAYVFSPSLINANGFNKDSANLTLAQVNAYKTTLTPPDLMIDNGSDFKLSNWTALGWGSTLADVLTNYNAFITNNFINSTQKLAINPGFQDVTSYIASGTIDGESYFVPFLAWANQSSISTNLYETLPDLADYLADYTSEFKNPSFYSYWLDGTAVFMNDGGGDMYDSGNFTHPRYLISWKNDYVANGQYTESSLDAVSYSSTNSVVDTNFKYASLGYFPSASYPYETDRPLIVIGTRNTVGDLVGFQKNGNQGADGSGSLRAVFVYEDATVNGFKTYAYIRHIYNAGDPSICDVYLLLGHPNWGSTFGTVSNFSANSTNSGYGYLYTSGAGVKNILAASMLLSKSGGAQVTDAEVQGVISNFTSRIKQFYGF